MSRVVAVLVLAQRLEAGLRITGRSAQDGVVGDHTNRPRRGDQRVDTGMDHDRSHLAEWAAADCQTELIGSFERQRSDGEDAATTSRKLGVDLVACHSRQGGHVERLLQTLELIGQACRPQPVLGLVEDLVPHVHRLAVGDASGDEPATSGVPCRPTGHVHSEGDGDGTGRSKRDEFLVLPDQAEERACHRADQHSEPGACQHVVIPRGVEALLCRRRSPPTPARCAPREVRLRSSTRFGDRRPARSGS